MIKTLDIKNFKSIKAMRLDCQRINVFIGEPNTGKSNTLEAMGIFCYTRYYTYGNSFKDFVRFERVNNLFYDESLDEPIRIDLDELNFRLSFKDGAFRGEFGSTEPFIALLQGRYDDLRFIGGQADRLKSVKFYRFAVQQIFGRPESDFLLPPSGANLMSLLLAHRELRTLANDIFSRFGLKLNLRPQENKIEVTKQLEDILISYPYSLVSDTLQRTIFYLVAIRSNKDSILVFEEPESHAFPYYTKYLAETIALDNRNNQFFISTHNPYLLLPLLEKAPKEDLAIFITYFEDYQTKIRPLSLAEMEEIMEIDVFSNLDRFVNKVK